MIIKGLLTTSIVASAFCLASAQSGQGAVSTHTSKLEWCEGLKDVSVYLKPKYNLINTWDQEFGAMVRVLYDGNFVAVTNFCYDPLYPVAFNRAPRYSAGLQFTYYFTQAPMPVGVYTKPKYDLFSHWKEESGVTTRLYTSKSLIISTNLAYVWNYPYISGQAPNWLALINFQFPLGR